MTVWENFIVEIGIYERIYIYIYIYIYKNVDVVIIVGAIDTHTHTYTHTHIHTLSTHGPLIYGPRLTERR